MSRGLFSRILLILIIVAGILGLPCNLFAQGRSDLALQRVMQIQERNTERFMAREGVVGTAVGLNENGRHEVMILLEKPGVPRIPDNIEGVPVRPVVTGRMYALKKPPWAADPGGEEEPTLSPTDSWPRPVPIGISTGNANEIAAGTIGCRVIDSAGNIYALSNNHVFAMENFALIYIENKILQPGRYDLPGYVYTQDDVIGNLVAFVPIDFEGGINYVDAAIALTSVNNLDNATPSDGYGIPQSTTQEAVINLPVKKYGRTTGLTKGKIYAVNAIVNIYYYYHENPAIFADQIIITPGTFSDGGDSGSLIVIDGKAKTKADNCKPVGLLFAGSSLYTIANPIDRVRNAFKIEIDGQ